MSGSGGAVAFVVALGLVWSAEQPPANRAALADFERRVTANPEDLFVAADYRQMTIAAGEYDRSIHLLEKLADAKNSGPNVHISLALALVDKVPPSGDVRRLFLARDAMSAATHSIERRPSVLAYYIRGLISLYFNRFMFHRVPQGIQDLEQARRRCDASTPPALVARVLVSLGDGYWKNDQRDKAREVWQGAAARFPNDAALKRRLSDERETERAVFEALYASTRVDTSLREMRGASLK